MERLPHIARVTIVNVERVSSDVIYAGTHSTKGFKVKYYRQSRSRKSAYKTGAMVSLVMLTLHCIVYEVHFHSSLDQPIKFPPT